MFFLFVNKKSLINQRSGDTFAWQQVCSHVINAQVEQAKK